MLVTIFATAMFMWAQFGKATQRISGDYAKFYTDKLVGDLGSYINREIGIAISVSKNAAIMDWMKNETDGERKAAAFRELQTYLHVFQDRNGFIALEDSKDAYYMNEKSGRLNIEAQGIVSPGNAADAWYFTTLEQTESYRMNIEYNRMLHMTRAWINVRVQEGGRNLGAFGTGLYVDAILQRIFSKYQHDGIMSVIVDQQGRIVVDSVGSNASLSAAALNASLYQYSGDPSFARQIKDYLAAPGKPAVIRMNHNHYQYAAIAPILDSNWHVVTFFRQSAVYAPVNFSYILVMFLLIAVIMSVAISFIVKRIFTSPFEKLRASLQGKEAHQNHSIYGLDRQDEFGVLAQSIQRMTDRIVQSVPVGIFLLDQDGRLIYGNPCFLGLFDCESKEQFKQWAGRRPSSLFARRDDYMQIQAFLLDAADECFLEAELLNRWQQSFWAEVHLAKVSNAQGGCHYEGLLINVQAKKNHERELRDMAATDYLTGVFNRHHFEQSVMSELDQYDNGGGFCTMIFFDLDHFKHVNDTWGHDAGDEVLVSTAEIVRQCIRKSDIILRWGGEEFAILLLDCGLSGGMRIAEDIRQQLENRRHVRAGIVTASFGVAQRGSLEKYADWFKRADVALYQAKQRGRNQVVADESHETAAS